MDRVRSLIPFLFRVVPVIVFFLSVFTPKAYAGEGIVFARSVGYAQTDLYFYDFKTKKTITISADPERAELFNSYTGGGRFVFTRALVSEKSAVVYSIRIGDKAPVRLGKETAQVFQFVAGKKVVYLNEKRVREERGYDMFSVDIDGNNHKSLASAELVNVPQAVTKDKATVVYEARGGAGGGVGVVRVVGIDGAGDRALSPFPGRNFYDGITDGGIVVFENFTATGKGSDIYAVNAGTGRLIEVSAGKHDDQYERLFSDGRLFFRRVDKKELYLADLRLEKPEPVLILKDDARVSSVKAGDFAVLTVSLAQNRTDIYLLAPDAVLPVRITGSGELNTFNALSAGRVVYSEMSSGGTRDIYTVLPDGTGRLLVAGEKGDDWFRDVTPDGHIIYDRIRQDEKTRAYEADVCVIKVDGTGKKCFGSASTDETLIKITKSGKLVVRKVAGYRNADIYVWDYNTGAAVTIAASADDEVFNAEAPDGRIIYTRVAMWGKEEEKKRERHLRRKQGDIYIIGQDGKGRKTVANDIVPEIFVCVINDKTDTCDVN